MIADIELLRLAAKAVGGEFSPGTTKFRTGATWDEWEWIGPQGITAPCFVGTSYPSTDDGDALRLAVELEIELSFMNGDTHADGQSEGGPDKRANTRRAILRAAAAIGRGIP